LSVSKFFHALANLLSTEYEQLTSLVSVGLNTGIQTSTLHAFGVHKLLSWHWKAYRRCTFTACSMTRPHRHRVCFRNTLACSSGAFCNEGRFGPAVDEHDWHDLIEGSSLVFGGGTTLTLHPWNTLGISLHCAIYLIFYLKLVSDPWGMLKHEV